MSIPKEKIEEVRERASIVQVINEYVPLTKRGHNHVGLCPFHSEKSPSFTVNEEKKIFYCFGCNETGNVITFLMKKDGLAFPEAVRALASRYGITINESKSGVPDERDQIYSALKAASEYFSGMLRTTAGDPAKEYLKGRGLTGELAKRFLIGFAPNKWDGLFMFLKKKGIGVDAACKAGLLVKKDKGPGCYDRFRNRVIFPITDVRGRIIGFGGRAMDDKSLPKYLNSPESPVFKKGETLFGLAQAKEAVSKEGFVLVVEGYFDLVALHRHGFLNSVATMGTALTTDHIRILKGYTSSIYALFDSDEAGKKAALRGLNLFLNEDISCRAVLLNQGKDPDEFLQLAGPDALREAIVDAPTLMEFYLGSLRARLNMSAPEGKKKYFEDALSYLSKIGNLAERGHYATIVASTLGIGVDSVYDAIKGASNPGNLKVKSGFQARSLPELTLLRVIMKHPELLSPEVEAAFEAFTDNELKAAARAVAGLCHEGVEISGPALLERVEGEALKGAMAELLFRDMDGFVEEPARMVQDSLKSIMNRGKVKTSTQDMIKLLEQMGKSDIAIELRKRIEVGPSGKRH
ncbi:MAG: DNA primase [Deltaproteobacteria bacterium GWA2_54_12]|nr:MAG: DNA primase [Deltaproteobacteria bacterium GWA2_54_12]